MQRSKIKKGGLYAYKDGRLNEYSAVEPLLVLDENLYAWNYRRSSGEPGKLTPAEDWQIMAPGDMLRPPVGLPAVRIFNGSDVADLDARIELVTALTLAGDFDPETFRSGATLRDSESGDETSLGEYVLINRSAHLHGDYAKASAEREEADRVRRERQSAVPRERSELAARRKELLDRLGALGVQAGAQDTDYGHARLSLDDLAKLIGLAEKSTRP